MENQPLKKNDEGPNEIQDEEAGLTGQRPKQEEDPTCWESTTEGIKQCIKGTYFALAWVFNRVRDGCGFVCYPLKEQCHRCCRKIDLWMNPYQDATIHYT